MATDTLISKGDTIMRLTTLFAACIPALSFGGNVATNFNARAATEQELVDYVQHIKDTAKSGAEVWQMIRKARIIDAVCAKSPSCCATVDNMLVPYSNDVYAIWHYRSLPKLTMAGWKNRGISPDASAFAACAVRLNSNAQPYALLNRGATMDELVNCLSEICSTNSPFMGVTVKTSLCAAIQKAGVRLVKRHLRDLGESFVADGGKNPCAPYMEELNAALNAPRFNGLNEWLAKMGVEARLDASRLPSEAEVNALKDRIYYGECDMNDRRKYILHTCLGVDGYNAFVKQYNGGK